MAEELNSMEAEKTPEIRLHKATIEDIPQLIAVEQKVANIKTYSAMIDEKEWKVELDKKDATVYLILRDDVVVGDASYEKRGTDGAYISGLVIDPDFQGQGLGRQAMTHILEDLKDTKRIELVVHPENEGAIKLYLSFGFVIEEQKENYFGDGEPRVVMVKRQDEAN